MLSKRRERFYKLIYQASEMTTDDLGRWLTNSTVARERGFLLARLACLRIYTSRTDRSGRTYARQRDAARVRLGLLSRRLRRALDAQRLTNAGKPWDVREDLQLRGLYFAGHALDVIADRLQRTGEGVERRLVHLQLITEEDRGHA